MVVPITVFNVKSTNFRGEGCYTSFFWICRLSYIETT